MRKEDTVTIAGARAAQQYVDIKKPSIIWAPVDEYIAKSKLFSKIAQP
jgi:hypothetical protein